MAQPKQPKLPDTIFVRWSGEDDCAYLAANEKAEDLLEGEKEATGGEYKLVRKVCVATRIEVTPEPQPKRK